MPAIKLENICKYICRDVGLEIRDRELLVLLGPSGAGKTTLLNIIAGLTDYDGSVLFDSQRVDKLPASKRGVGYLFQDLFLFPHLDVSANIAYGLKARKPPRDGVKERVEELLHLMKISHLAERYPKHLSGGEKQRVALARALALSPRVLLLDEPLSSLDGQTAKYLRTELKQLQRKLGITTIYVTHDLAEAEEMADRIAVIQDGRLQQLGRTEEVFFSPVNEAVSDFIGAPNILHCDRCQSLGQGVMEANCGTMSIILPDDGNPVRRIALFPRDIYVSETMPPGPAVNRYRGVVTDIKPLSDAVRLEVKVGEHKLLAEVPHHIFEEMDLAEGKEVFLILKLRRIKVY
ncbi:MAG TPA: ABC transporter ATP-binding protein [Dehalococcoidales bacterium]|nr:ABC transporter ATP-binding protein [Dehalococcoidales bacterium]